MPCMNQHRRSWRRSRTVFLSRTRCRFRFGTRLRPGPWVCAIPQEKISTETWAWIRPPAARPARRAAQSQRPRAAWLGSRTRFPAWDMYWVRLRSVRETSVFPILRHLNRAQRDDYAPRSHHPRPQIPSQLAAPNLRRRGPVAALGERVRPRGVRQTCQAVPGAPGGALAVLRRARPPLGRSCKVRPRPRSPVFRGAHGRLAPPTRRARPSGACEPCRAEAGAPGSAALAVPLRARLLCLFRSPVPHSARLHSTQRENRSRSGQYFSCCQKISVGPILQARGSVGLERGRSTRAARATRHTRCPWLQVAFLVQPLRAAPRPRDWALLNFVP